MARISDGKLRFGIALQGGGGHWRDPSVMADGAVRLETYMEYARIGEAAKFDFGFIADSAYITKDSSWEFVSRPDPLTVLSAVSTVTTRLGLLGTWTTSYSYPFTTARQLASLDMISRGRAGWNVVTSAYPDVARNFNGDQLNPHAERYAIADEYIEVCKGLWDSYEDDAFVRNRKTGVYLDYAKMHRLDHAGKYFQVQGPLNMERTPQGYPVIFQAGASDAGRNLGAKQADAVFSTLTDSDNFDTAREYANDIRKRAVEHGRSPDDVLIFPACYPIVGNTLEEAEEKYRKEASYRDVDQAIRFMSRFFNFHDFTQYPLDEPLPDLAGVAAETAQGFQSVTANLVKTAREERLTLRELAYRVAFPKGWFVGAAETVADMMQRQFEERAVDGYIIIGTHRHLRDFTELVIPILQQRGLFRTEYEAETFRGNLGLDRPPNRYALARS